MQETALPCVACRRGDVTTLVCMVVAEGDPAPVCAACFGTLTVRVSMSAAMGCDGCQALQAAVNNLLDQLDKEGLPLSANPTVPHNPACLLR